ncbi:MAG: hypothetical protein IJD64_06510, partial [Clostridia bacterium]|nr:hypothetical protein [Clostridia bacterium]
WHDTDATLKIRPTQLLALMQETSNRHIATSGMSLDELREQKKLGFILSKTRVEIDRRPSAFETITVETWTNPSRSFGFNRSFLVRVGEETVAKADTFWALVGIEDRKFHKMEETGYVCRAFTPCPFSYSVGSPTRAFGRAPYCVLRH